MSANEISTKALLLDFASRAQRAQAGVDRILKKDVLPDPCPFCASIDAKPDEIDIRIWAVCCYRCGATGPHSDTSPQHAISKWNMVKQ